MLTATASAGSADSWSSVAATSDSAPSELSDTCALLALLVQNQCTSQSASKTDVELDFKKLQELKQQLADAIQKAKDAANESGFFGFLSSVFGSDVAQIAGAVAAIAAVVATGGAAAPLILMAVSVALEEGAKVGAKLGLDPKLCLAISLASAAVGLCSGTGAGTAQVAGSTAAVAHDVEVGANVVRGGAAVAGGTLGYVSGHYQAKQLGFQADATGYQAQSAAKEMDLDTAIALLQDALRTEQGETRTVSAVVQSNADINTALCDRI